MLPIVAKRGYNSNRVFSVGQRRTFVPCPALSVAGGLFRVTVQAPMFVTLVAPAQSGENRKCPNFVDLGASAMRSPLRSERRRAMEVNRFYDDCQHWQGNIRSFRGMVCSCASGCLRFYGSTLRPGPSLCYRLMSLSAGCVSPGYRRLVYEHQTSVA